MKIVGERLPEGRVTIIPQDSNDLYHLYHIIAKGDRVEAKTSRKIKTQDVSESSDRISVWLEIEVEEMEFHGFGDTLRIRGLITKTSEERVSLNSYHTMNIDLLKQLTIIKEIWSPDDLDRLRNAQMGSSSPLVIVAIDDEGAVVGQVGDHASKVLVEMQPTIPRKGSDPNQHQQAMKGFFKELGNFLRQLRDEDIARYIIIGGPGFTGESFLDFITNNYQDLRQDTTLVAANSAGIVGLREIITHRIPDNYVAAREAITQASLVEEVLDNLGRNTNLIAYGSDIPIAVEMGAVAKLLVLDKKIRGTVDLRDEVQALMKQVRNFGGSYTLMSSMHDSGNIIEGLGGLVAILRFALPK